MKRYCGRILVGGVVLARLPTESEFDMKQKQAAIAKLRKLKFLPPSLVPNQTPENGEEEGHDNQPVRIENQLPSGGVRS